MAGMHAVALGSGIAPEWKHDETYVGRMEKGESIEITTCSEEVSQDQREILQERQLINNPVKMCMRSCVDHINGVVDDAATPKKSKRPRKETSMLDKISKIVTILQWVPDLTCHKVRADLVAGLTVGVMVIPQSMSYGAIAGLPYINGMYSACISTLIYAFFGQSCQLAVGPVAMVSLLVEAGLNGQLGPECTVEGKPQYETCPQEYVGLACLTAAVVGVMQILASVLKLGFLVTFLGHPVISGFTSGAAIIIGLSQLKYILGFDLPKSQYIYETIYNVIIKIDQTKGMPLLLGILWIAYLLGNKHLAQKYKRLKMLGPLGPLISCLVGTVLIGVFHEFFAETYHVKYVGEIPSGIMPLSLDAWQLDKIPTVLGTAMSACLIGYMESIAIGKNLAATNGYDIDAGQEMLALGIANVVGAAFSCYPVTGSFSRSAVNNSTGALSQLSGVITAVVMLATLMFLTPLFYYLPKFALAAIVMNSVIPLVAFGEARHLFHVKKHDFVLWVTAFLGTLFLGVLMGILVSVGLSLVIVIYESARPQITILWRIPGTSIYRNMKQENNGTFIQNVFIARIGSSLYFANASFVKEMLLAHVTDLEEVNKTQYIVLEMTPVISVDSTACHVIKDVVNDFRMRGMHVAFAMTGNRVEKTLRKAGLKKFIGEQWFFPTVEEAVQYCVKHQHARRRQSEREEMESQNHAKSDEIDISTIQVHWGNEIGFSNDLHSNCSMVFVSLSKDVPMIMTEITGVFKKNHITIIRAQIDPTADDMGAKHIYFVRSLRTDSKLSSVEVSRVREDLEVVLRRHKLMSNSFQALNEVVSPNNGEGVENNEEFAVHGTPDRLARLEEALVSQQELNRNLEASLRSLLNHGGARGCLPQCLPANLLGRRTEFG